MGRKKKITIDLPLFVSINGTALMLRGNVYHRHAGLWDLDYKIIDGKLLSWCPTNRYTKMPWLHRKPLIEITQDEWKKNNAGYVDENYDYSITYKGNVESEEDNLAF